MLRCRLVLGKASVLLAAVALIGVPHIARADWAYDFEGGTVGDPVETSSPYWVPGVEWWNSGHIIATTTSGAYTGSKAYSADNVFDAGTYMSIYTNYAGENPAPFGLSSSNRFSLQADFQFLESTQDASKALILGLSAVPNAMTIVANQRAPYFGFRYGFITLRETYNNNNPVVDVAYGSITGLDVNDWISLKMVVDPTANDGKGSAELLYKNLTDQQTDWTLLGSGALRLDLLADGAGSLDQMIALQLHNVQGTATAPAANLDNLLLVTNLDAPTAEVPEPSSLSLVGLALAGLLGCARRRK